MTLRFGEVVLVRMQFHEVSGAKVRPAIVLLDTGDDDFVAAPITSQARHSEYDLAMEDWRAAGLNVASYIRVRTLGSLPERAGRPLVSLLCRTFCQTTAET